MNNPNVVAVLIDVVSIQAYVFGSNKLKENIGASYHVEDVYRSHLEEAVRKAINTEDIDFNAWRSPLGKIKIKEEGVLFEVGYIGGGNALLLFREEYHAKEFIKEWTRTLLVETPGLTTAIALDTFNVDNSKAGIKSLFDLLKRNKSSHVPQTVIPRHGITSECPRTGYSMDIWNDIEEDKKEYISSVSYSKIKVVEEQNGKRENATKKLEDKLLNKEQKEEYCFINDLGKLGQAGNEKNYIAIVHIDGNDIGKKFQDAEFLSDRRELSRVVTEATDNSFKEFLTNIIKDYTKILKALGIDSKVYKEDGRRIIPVRPIILGGDDITFVCDGRMGIYFAKIFMEKFGECTLNGEKLTACAGVAITKTKYPFSRGYLLAEQLCKCAKEFRKGKNINGRRLGVGNQDKGSWIDFHISSGGFSETISEIRDSYYCNHEQGNLIARPYMINSEDKSGFDLLVKKTKRLKNTLARTKIKDLRNIMTMGQEETRKFLNLLSAKDVKEDVKDYGSFLKGIFENKETPYFDMIELMEFYPSFELEKKRDES